MSRTLDRVRYYLPTIVVAVAVLGIWELVVTVFNIQQFILPKPSQIVMRFFEEVNLFVTGQGSILFQASGATFYEALGGFILGCGSGILVALVTARFTCSARR